LIDASVSIKVAVNYGNYKNRLGAYHAPMHTFLDFTFLRTLPTAQIRNGFAELIKISTCSHLDTFNLLDKYCEQLIDTAFGRTDGAPKEVRKAADKINKEGIHEMLKLETPNLHEIGLDRVIAYGHTLVRSHEAFYMTKFNLRAGGHQCMSSCQRRPYGTVTPSPLTWHTRQRWPTTED